MSFKLASVLDFIRKLFYVYLASDVSLWDLDRCHSPHQHQKPNAAHTSILLVISNIYDRDEAQEIGRCEGPSHNNTTESKAFR